MPVPPEIDAFFFVERAANNSSGLSRATILDGWLRRGWNVVELAMHPATPYLTSTRFTSKVLKFLPPANLLKGREWVVSFDADIYIRLPQLPAFLSSSTRRSVAPLLMVDWRHWPGNLSLSAFECMEQEMWAMLDGPMQNFVTSSRAKCLEWREMMRQLHAERENSFPVNYYDTSFIIRHLTHPRAAAVSKAFVQILRRLRTIERDQFVVPFYLWKANLSQELQLIDMSELQRELGHCQIPGFHRHEVPLLADSFGVDSALASDVDERAKIDRRLRRTSDQRALGPVEDVAAVL